MNFTAPIKDTDKDDWDSDLDADGGIEDGEADPRHQLGKKLLSMGRTYYKQLETTPEWLNERLNEITSYRTVPQIRRCLKSWLMKLDRDEMKKYAVKSIGWGK